MRYEFKKLLEISFAVGILLLISNPVFMQQSNSPTQRTNLQINDCLEAKLELESNAIKKRTYYPLNLRITNRCNNEIVFLSEPYFLFDKVGVDKNDRSQIKSGNHLKSINFSANIEDKILKISETLYYLLDVNDLQWIDTMASTLLVDSKSSKIIGENIFDVNLKKGKYYLQMIFPVKTLDKASIKTNAFSDKVIVSYKIK